MENLLTTDTQVTNTCIFDTFHQNVFSITFEVPIHGMLKMRQFVFVLWTFCCFWLHSNAQGVRLFTSADGLPGSQFASMGADALGNVWSCHYGGLSRFDGMVIKTFYESPASNGLRSNTIFRFVTDALGQSWVCTSNGLQRYHPKTEWFENIPLEKAAFNVRNKQKSYQISALAFIPKTNLMLVCAGNQGFCLVDIQTHQPVQNPNHPLLLMLKKVMGRGVFCDSKNRLWVVSDKLLLFDLNTYKPLNYKVELVRGVTPTNMEVTDLLQDAQTGAVLVADNWNGVFLFDERNQTLRSFSTKATPYIHVQCLLQLQNGDILVGCEKNGIGKLDFKNHLIEAFPIKDAPLQLEKSKIHALYEDAWKNLYVGIFQKGLLVVPALTDGFRFQKLLTAGNTTIQSAVTSMVQAPNGEMMVCTDGEGVFAGAWVDNLSKIQMPSNCNGSIQDVATAKDGRMWVGAYGSGFFGQKGGVVTSMQNNSALLNKNVSRLLLDKTQTHLYIGSVGGGLIQLDLRSGIYKKIPLESTLVFTLYEDAKQRIWIGGTECFCYDPRLKRLLPFTFKGLENVMIQSFLQVGNQMYIGTTNGLFVFDEKNDQCRRFPFMDDGRVTTVLSIIKSGAWVWMSTNKGLMRFHPRNHSYRMYATYEIKKVGDFHRNAVFRKADGKLVFGGDHGVVSFNPKAIEQNKTLHASLQFNTLQVNGKDVDYKVNASSQIMDAAIGFVSKIRLPYPLNSFSVGFSTKNYALSSRLTFQYQLQGLETDWHTASPENPRAVYHQLPPGKYTLLVRSLNENQEVERVEKSLKVVVLPPWYWTWWMKSIYLMFLLAFALIQYRAYQNRQMAKKRLRDLMGEFLKIKETYQQLLQKQVPVHLASPNQMETKLKNLIMEVIVSHLADPNFSVEQLSAAVGLSRVHLYRKTKELFQCAPNDLLKSVRLKKAGLMLVQGKGSISEIAYQVGFSEPSYFSKSFKSFYNMTPKAFISTYRDHYDDETVQQLFDL